LKRAERQRRLLRSKKPDTAIRKYEHNGNWLQIVPSVKRLATIYDKDILIYCISQIMERRARLSVVWNNTAAEQRRDSEKLERVVGHRVGVEGPEQLGEDEIAGNCRAVYADESAGRAI